MAWPTRWRFIGCRFSAVNMCVKLVASWEIFWEKRNKCHPIYGKLIILHVHADPPDTVKSRLQVQGTRSGTLRYTSTADAFSKMFRTEGIGGFYRGFGAILITAVPANMCYFSGYELGKKLAPRHWGVSADILTAVVAQTIAGVVFCPIDIVKQRVQTAQVLIQENCKCQDQATKHLAGGRHPIQITAWRAAYDVWSRQGIRGFYRGYWTMNALWMPWNLVYISLYESSKRRIYRWCSKREIGWQVDVQQHDDCVRILHLPPMSQALPLWAYPLSSSSSAAIAATLTHPIDVVKTRLQVLSAANVSGSQWTVAGVACDLWRKEGVRGFARGLLPRVLTLSIGSSTSWFVYEIVKKNLEGYR